MAEFASQNYQNNFLSQVIARIDFLQCIPTDTIFKEEVEKAIIDIFPRRGMAQLIKFNTFNIVFDGVTSNVANANNDVFDGRQREYQSLDGKNKVILSNKFLIFEINSYSGFDEHIKWMRKIFNVFFDHAKPIVNRTGIRYINIFDQSKISLKKNYFCPEVAAVLLIKKELVKQQHILRSMHVSEYRIDDMCLNFKYGMYNPDYPSIMTKNDFVLDLDCFTEVGIDNADDILKTIIRGHGEIQRLFEQSITDSLREVMLR